jgi:membrane protein
MREVLRDPLDLIIESALGFMNNDGPGLSAEAAYRVVIAMPAVVILFTSVSTFVARYTGVDAFQALLDRARDGLPFEVYSTLELILSSIEEQSGIGVFAIGLAIALWSGSNAIASIVKGINRAHNVEEVRGVIRRRLVAMALLVGLGILILTSFILIIFGAAIGNEIGSAFGLGNEFNILWDMVRWPLLFAMFMGSLACLYWVGPARTVDRRAILPGAILATILWLIASYGFNIYLMIVDPGSAYGVVGSIIAVMLFVYISSIIITFGAEVNATVRRRLEGGLITPDQAEHPLDLIPNPIVNPTTETSSRTAAWAVVGMLVGGAMLGSLLKRGSGNIDTPEADL